MKNIKILTALSLCLLSVCPLSGCGSSNDDELSLLSPAAGGPLLPLPGTVANDPDNNLFMVSISEWLKESGAPANSQYEFTRIDLNGDGLREGLILLQSPHQEWCMDYGCTMFIFQAHEEGFSYLSEVSPVRGPLVVTNQTTNGYRDIMAYVSGRSAEHAKNVALKYNGTAYPMQPALEQAVAVNTAGIEGVKIFP